MIEKEVGRQHQRITGPEFAKSQTAAENREKWRKPVVKSTVAPPTTPAVKGLVKVVIQNKKINE